MMQRSILLILFLSNLLVIHSQVNLQTGAAQFSLPLYNYSDPNNKLATGISLVYTAGNGLKVGDMGTPVGTGWDLGFGGVITRIQHGEPDDQKQEGSFPYPYINPVSGGEWLNYVNNYYPNGYMYSEFTPSIPVNNGAATIPMLPGNYTGGYKQLPVFLTDREIDEFSLSFNGRQGRFVIGRDGEVKAINDSKLRIEKVITNMSSANIITRISEFQVIDENGIKYIFKDLELSEVMEYKTVLGGYVDANKKNNLITGNPKNRFVVQKWYLSEVENPATGKKLIYTYESYSVDMTAGKSGHASIANNKSEVSLTIERHRGQSRRIKTIKVSDLEEVVFDYSDVARYDPPYDKPLNEIKINYNGVLKYSWKFNFGYFVKGETKALNASLTQDQKYQSRICLLSVTKRGVNGMEEHPYLFSYYNGVYPYTENGYNYTANLEVAPLNSFYIDHRGYPNKTSSLITNSRLDEPRPDFNYSNIDWEQVEKYATNLFSIRNSLGLNYLAGTLKNVKYPLGGELTFEYEPNKTLGTGPGTIIGGVRVVKTTEFDGLDQSKNQVKEYRYVKENGTSSSWGYEVPGYQQVKQLRVFDCGNSYKPGESFATIASYIPSLAVGSLMNTNRGPLSGQQVARDLITKIVIDFLFAILGPDYVDYTATEFSTISKTAGNELPFQYSRVEVINGSSTSNAGKSIYQFTSDQEYPFDFPTLTVPNSSKPRYASWAYGLLKSIVVKDNLDKTVSKVEYDYDYIKNTLTDGDYGSQKWVAIKLTYFCELYPDQNLTWPTDHIASDFYYPIYGRMQLKQTKEYKYNDNNEYTLLTTDYEYSSSNYQVSKVKTTNSRGELIETNTYYPGDYTLTGILETVRQRNMLNVPVSTQTLITKGGQKYLLSGSVSEFGTAPNGDIKPVKTYSSRGTEPVISTSVSFNQNQLIPGTGIYKEAGSIIYNHLGLPVQIISDKGKVSTVYDYENKVAVATVVNASYNDIAYTSFEADGAGGWQFNPANIVAEFAVTGRKYFTFPVTGTAITRALNQAASHTLSFWAKGNAPYVYKLSGTAAVVFAPQKTYVNAATGWTYYEYVITAASSVFLDNSLNSTVTAPYSKFSIDELKLYPVNSRMSTICYDPVVGKIGETDASGRITYYEYDDLGRLKLVMDENRNVIKTYEYNYKQ